MALRLFQEKTHSLSANPTKGVLLFRVTYKM